MLNYFKLYLIVFIATLFLTEILVILLNKYNIVDVPSERRNHLNSTPRGGGIGFIIIYFCCIILSLNDQYQKIVLPFTLISGISLFDDLKNISVVLRLITHICSSIIAYYLMIFPNQLFDILPQNIDKIVCCFSILMFLNIYNFLDGVDAITAVESIYLSIIGLILCYFKYHIIQYVDFVIFTLVIINAFSCSFIFFNWHPAKIFLGDSGSISLGFILAMCLLLISISSFRLLNACIIASLYYLADGGLTILIRLKNREKIWQPHLKHFFQQALKKNVPPTVVVYKISTCNFVLGLCAVGALYSPIISNFIALIVVSFTLKKFSYA